MQCLITTMIISLLPTTRVHNTMHMSTIRMYMDLLTIPAIKPKVISLTLQLPDGMRNRSM